MAGTTIGGIPIDSQPRPRRELEKGDGVPRSSFLDGRKEDPRRSPIPPPW